MGRGNYTVLEEPKRQRQSLPLGAGEREREKKPIKTNRQGQKQSSNATRPPRTREGGPERAASGPQSGPPTHELGAAGPSPSALGASGAAPLLKERSGTSSPVLTR